MAVLQVSDLEVIRGSRSVVQGALVRRRERRKRDHHGSVRVREDERAARYRWARSNHRRSHRRRRRVDRSWTDPCRSTAARAVSTCWDGLSVSPLVRAPQRDPQRVAGAGARAAGAAQGGRTEQRSGSSSRWVWPSVLTRCPMSCREVRHSEWRSPVRWRWGHRCC